jgi:hypothetical protein
MNSFFFFVVVASVVAVKLDSGWRVPTWHEHITAQVREMKKMKNEKKFLSDF